MSPLVALWIASIAGALLFFFSGFFSGRALQAADPVPEADGLADDVSRRAGEIEAAQAAQIGELRRQLLKSAQELEQVRVDAAAALDRERTDSQRLATELQMAQNSAGAANARLAEMRRGREAEQRTHAADEKTRSSAASARVVELTRRLESERRARTEAEQAARTGADQSATLIERVRQLEQELEASARVKRQLGELMQSLKAKTRDSEQWRTKAQELEAELASVRVEVERLSQVELALQGSDATWQNRLQRLQERALEAEQTIEGLQSNLATQAESAQAALSLEMDRSQQEQRKRDIRARMLAERVAELEAYAEENSELKHECERLRQEVVRLRRAIEAAEATAEEPNRVAERPSLVPAPAESGTTWIGERGLTLEASLKEHLAGLLAGEPNRTAVLSDDNGFQVAGVGPEELQEGVSVLTSLAHELASRAPEFVELDGVEVLELADRRGTALRVRFFEWEGEPLALGCLGKRSLTARRTKNES